MIGELSIGGVYLPALLLLSAIALAMVALVGHVLALIGVYRFLAYRPLVDVALFVILLGLLVWRTGLTGLPA